MVADETGVEPAGLHVARMAGRGDRGRPSPRPLPRHARPRPLPYPPRTVHRDGYRGRRRNPLVSFARSVAVGVVAGGLILAAVVAGGVGWYLLNT